MEFMLAPHPFHCKTGGSAVDAHPDPAQDSEVGRT